MVRIREYDALNVADCMRLLCNPSRVTFYFHAHSVAGHLNEAVDNPYYRRYLPAGTPEPVDTADRYLPMGLWA